MKNKMKHSFSRVLSLLLALLLLTSLLPTQVRAAGASSLDDNQNKDSWLENKAIHVDVSKDSGAFYIRTVAGDKLVKGDENANLLWPSEDDTSFTSVRITRNGVTKDYIFGKNYGSGNAVTVTNDGTQITAVWSVDSVTFTQTIRLQPTGNDAHGMVVINYSAKNSGAPADIQIRVLLDTAMGGKDYAYYNTGSAAVVTETELGANGYDKSIYLMDDPSDPLVTGYILNGSVNGAECKPVKTVLAHWANLASTVFDYTPDTTLNFTNAFNAKHLTSDSAVALYYDLGSVSQNGTANAQFNYGLYSNEKVSGYAVAVNLQTIDALSFTDASESAFQNDGKFTAKTILQNASQKTYAKVRVYAYASGGISVLNSNESATDGNGKTYGYDNPYYVEINDFTPGQKVNNLSDWHFQAVMAAEANYGRIHFKAYDMSNNPGDTPLENDLIGEARKYILVPGSQEKLPNIQLTGSSPAIFHTEGHRVFNVTGMKFAQLESEFGNAYCTLKLSRKDGGEIRDGATALELPKPAFSINEDGSGLMTMKIDGTLPEGEYKVTVDYTDAGRTDINAKALEFQVIDDGRYKCETYGFVVIYHDEAADKDGNNPKHNYLVKTFADEGMYNAWKDENDIEETDVLMIFKGVFDDLTESLPEEEANRLKDDEFYACYLSASLSGDDTVLMSDALEFSEQDSGSSVVIKEIRSGEGDDERHSVKVDFNCKVSIAGVGTTVFNQGVSCFTELKGGKNFKLIEYDESGERDDTVGNTICLLWPRCDVVQQAVMGAFFNFRYAELGVIPNSKGGLTRTVGFGGGLDLSCIIPSADEYYTWEEMYPQDEKYKVTADEQRAWNEAWDIRNEDRSFREENEARKNGALANGFYDEDDNFQYTGSVQVSDVLFGAKSFLGFNISVGVGIPSLGYNLPSIEGVFTLRTLGQTEFRVNGSMQFFNFELEALLDLKANDIGILIPDELKFFIGGITPGYNLDPWGVLWLQGGGGGIKDLYDTIYLQDKVPPIKLILQAQFSIMQVMVAKATVEAGLTGLGVALTDVRIQGTDIGVMDSAVIAVRWYPNLAFIGSVQVDLLECIQGGGYIVGYINYDGSNPFLEFFLRAALHLPESIPIVGGMTIGGVNMGISSERIFGSAEVLGIGVGFSYYWRNEFDWGMKNEATPTFPELLGLGQEFDSDIDEMFENIPTPDDDDDDADQNAPQNSPKAIPVYYDEENHRTLMAVPGTNFVRDNTVVVRGEGSGGTEPGQNTLNIAPDGKTIEASLADNGKSKIVVLTWSSESEDAAKTEAVSIVSDAYKLTLLDHNKDANEQRSANANLSYDEAAKKATLAFTVTDSSVKTLHLTSPFALDAVLYDVDALPGLRGCTASLDGTTLNVYLDGSSLDSFDFVNVGLIKESELAAAEADSKYIPEITLVGRIEKNAEGHLPASKTLVLPADLPSGSYVVRLMAQDEAQTQASQLDLTAQAVNYVNPNTPGKPTSIGSITGAGDWKVNVPINSGNTNDFDGYAVSVTDSTGAPVSGLTDLLFYKNGDTVQYENDGTLTVPTENQDAGQVTIGGQVLVPVSDTATDEGGMTATAEALTKTEIFGFQAGNYNVSVRKWKAANGVPVYSEALTQSFTVSEPEPANISITGNSTVNRTEQRGEETVTIPYYTNAGLLFTLNSNKPVTGTWVIDGMQNEAGYSGTFDTAITDASIPLAGLGIADGVHSITFTGKTAAGDTSSASYAFGVDNAAPALLIQSPENGGTYDGETGEVIITGVTDPDAILKVYDEAGTLTPTAKTFDDVTGAFSLTVSLSGGDASHQVSLTASDDLGNVSEKTFALRSQQLSSVTSVRLYENETDKTEQMLSAGTHTLRLVGKTADGQLVELSDPSMLEWDAQTLEGSALTAALSEDGTKFVVTAAEDTVGVITAKLLVNDAGAYPVSCMVGTTLSVNSDVITVEEGGTAPVGVSSRTGATLTFESTASEIATVTADEDGFATVSGVKTGVTSVTVTTSTGESATVTVIVTGSGYFPGKSLTLAGDIGVNFYVNPIDTDASNYKVVLTWVGGQTKTVQLKDLEPVPAGSICAGAYKVTAHVAAKEMTDRVTATLCYGTTPIAEDTYTVKNYCDTVLAHTDTYPEELCALAKAMLIYGAKAQTQFVYNTESPADKGMTYTLEAVPQDGLGTYGSADLTPFGIAFSGSSLVLRTKTTHRLYFTTEKNAETLNQEISVNCGSKILSFADGTGDNAGLVYVDIPDMAAVNVLKNYTVTVTRKEDGTQARFRVNAGAYIAKVLDDTQEVGLSSEARATLKNTVTALYWYSVKAEAYFRTME